MASTGISFAQIYVQQKLLKEKMKRREEEMGVRREKGPKDRKPSHKVHPSGVAAAEPAGRTGVGSAPPNVRGRCP